MANFPFSSSAPLRQWKLYVDLGTGGYSGKHIYTTWAQNFTIFFFPLFPLILWCIDSLLKLYVRDGLSVSAAVERSTMIQRWILWLYTIIMSFSTNNWEVCPLPRKDIKPLRLKKDVVLWFPDWSEAFLDGRLLLVHVLSSHLPEHCKLISLH